MTRNAVKITINAKSKKFQSGKLLIVAGNHEVNIAVIPFISKKKMPVDIIDIMGSSFSLKNL